MTSFVGDHGIAAVFLLPLVAMSGVTLVHAVDSPCSKQHIAAIYGRLAVLGAALARVWSAIAGLAA